MESATNFVKIVYFDESFVSDYFQISSGGEMKRTVEVLQKFSAAANADVKEMNTDNLYVAEVYAHQGPTMKRWRAGSQGRASIILKRSSHVGVTLKEKN